MQQLKLFSLLILSACLFSACSGNADGKNNPGVSVPSAKSTTANSTGDASFSCKIDGKSFSGNGTDQIINAASVHAPGIIYFTLSSKFTGDVGADLRGGGFGFEVPDKGTTIVRDVEESDYSVGYTLPGSSPLVNYRCKEMTVTITSSGGTRVSGTFSGTMIEPKTDREVPVTDGKFDIPYSSLSRK